MKKKALLLLLLGISIGYGVLCSLSDHFSLQNYDAFCASFYPHVYIGVGLSSLFFLLFTGIISLNLFTFIPHKFVHKLCKPPQTS